MRKSKEQLYAKDDVVCETQKQVAENTANTPINKKRTITIIGDSTIKNIECYKMRQRMTSNESICEIVSWCDDRMHERLYQTDTKI